MKEAIYIETTIPSLYVARPSPRLIEAGRQQLTRIWWENHRQEFDLVSSQSVLDECVRGDAELARMRLDLLGGVPLLDLNEEVALAADALLRSGILPPKAGEDAIHIAAASVHGINYLLTWNCKHIANPRIWRRIGECFRGLGHTMSIICTPEDLIGDEN